MALFVNTNVSSLSAQRNLSNVTNSLNQSFERLSSGSRINSARDDAAGLKISNRLNTQVVGLEQSTRNANDGIAIAQIAEGALGEITNNVQRMRQLVVQNGNGALSQDDREALSSEFQKLLESNNSIADRTAFGTKKLLDGSAPESGFSIQSGAFDGERDTIKTGNATFKGALQEMLFDDSTVTSTQGLSAMSLSTATAFGVLGKVAVAYYALSSGAGNFTNAVASLFGTNEGSLTNLDQNTSFDLNEELFAGILSKERAANGTADSNVADTLILSTDLAAFMSGSAGTVMNSTYGFSDDQLQDLRDYSQEVLLDFMSDMIGQVDSQRATLGAQQNGLMSTIRSNNAAIVNVSDAKSRIADTDFATETAALTRNQIIQQASNTILAQANQLPQAALSLLR